MKEVETPSEERVLKESREDELFNSGEIVLVMDTSFIIKLGQRNLWAYNVWTGIQKKAKEKEKQFSFFVSNEIIDEYDKLQSEKRYDEYGLPHAPKTLEDVVGSMRELEFSPSSAADIASREAWRSFANLRMKAENYRVRRGPNDSDLSVTSYARTIAQQGVEVYVASYDIRDVIGPLVHDRKRIAEEGIAVNPIGPSEIEIESFDKTDWKAKNGKLRPVINREVIADLQVAKLRPGVFTYVVFERNVHSGNATFDLVVGIEEFANPKRVQVPEKYKDTGGKFSFIRALRLHSRHNSGAANLIRSYFQRSKSNMPYRLLLLEEEDPFDPILIFPSGEGAGWYKWHRVFQTTTDFLNYQTDSAYAKRYYRPNRPNSRSSKISE